MALPLQVATFSGLATSPTILGDFDLTRDGAITELSPDGDLWVDSERLTAMVADHIGNLDVGHADHARLQVEQRCAAVRRMARWPGPPSDPGEARSRLLTAAAGLRAFMPLPVLGKVVSVALLDRLREEGFEGAAPVPWPSPGARLVTDLILLSGWCTDHGIPPADLAARWPDVPDEVAAEVQGFAAAHVGFGPLAWEAPGYGDVATIVAALALVDGEMPPDSGPGAPPRPRLGSSRAEAIFRLLAAWLDATEHGILLVREAFLVGVVRDLRALATSPRPSDALFMSFEEVVGTAPPQTVIDERRVEYLGDAAYLARNGVTSIDLDRLVP